MLIRIICFSNKKATRRVALVLVQLSLFVGGVILGRVYKRHPRRPESEQASSSACEPV